jgi:fused signal recognition particle receptor
MFKFLKDKIKSAVSKISEKIEEEGKKEEIEVPKVDTAVKVQEAEQPAQEEIIKTQEEPSQPETSKEEKKGFFSSIKSIFAKKEEEAKKETPSETKEEPVKEAIEPTPEPILAPEEKKSPVEIFAPQIVEEVKKEFESAKAEPTPAPPVQKHINKEVKKQPEPIKAAEPIKGKHPHVEQEKKPSVAHKVHSTFPQPLLKPAATPAPKSQIKAEIPITPAAQEKKPEAKQEPLEEKKGFFSSLKEKILTTTINEQQFEDMFFDMELALLENNVAVEVIGKIKHDLKASLVNQPIRRNKVEETVIISLKDSIKGLFETPFDLIEKIKEKEKKPYVVAFVGINGSGKTTSIAKMASMIKGQGFSVVLAAGDTFRAASIEQLSLHGEKIGIKVIKHDYGADPAAVAFDAIKHAEAKNADVVLIDTAGRMHSNDNLIQEMQKIMRVAKPDAKIFVGESITGNDCVDQAKSFNEAIGLDGIILSKADIDEKGGAAVSISYVTKKPILYIGTGQEYKDIKPFDSNDVMQNLGLEG